MADHSKKSLLEKAILNKEFDIALSLANAFRREFTKPQQRIIQIAYESMSSDSRKNFYKSLDVDIDKNYTEAIEILKTYI